ncbi:MAG: RsiV family protein [Muribaculaceae bacterium]|nr:RsiV family protein [Muribaculaceae bacterium]
MKLRSLLGFALAAVLVGGAAVSAEAVTKKSASRSKTRTTATKKSSQASAAKVVAGNVHNYSNGLSTQDFTVKKGESVIAIEFPIAGNEGIVNALKKYIVDAVYISDGKGNKATYSFATNETPETFLQKAIRPYKSKGSFGMNGEIIEQKVNVLYSDNDVITFQDSGYIYSGGTHEMPWEEGRSFLTSDGSYLTYSMLPSISVMRPYILAGLARTMEVSVDDLKDILYDLNVDYPGSEGATPYVDANGLNIQYSVYEIVPYASGMPKSIIPVANARKLCSGKALQFFN